MNKQKKKDPELELDCYRQTQYEGCIKGRNSGERL